MVSIVPPRALVAMEFLEHDQAPVLQAGSPEHSIFRSVWEAILAEAAINADIHPSAVNVRRFWFVENTIQLDCCSIPEWRKGEAEKGVQLFTDPIFESVAFFIHHQNFTMTYSKPVDLLRYKVGVIKGYTYRHEEYFGEQIEARDFTDLFEMIASGRADIATVNSQEFLYQMGQKKWPIVKGPVFHRISFRARVRKEHADLLPALNAAIFRMKKNGEIDRLIGQALREKIY